MRNLILVIILLFSIKSVAAQAPADSLLSILKSEIQRKQIYDDEKETRIRSLKKALSRVPAVGMDVKYNLCDKLFQEYKDFIFDSAHVYAIKLVQLSTLMHSPLKKYESRIKLSTIQLSWGMFKEAFEGLGQIDVRTLPDSLKVRYYELKSVAYISLSFYNTDKFYSSANRAQSIKSLDSALSYSKPESYERFRHTAEMLSLNGRQKEATLYYRKLLASDLLTTHQRAMVLNDLSNLITGPERLELITKAAIYDIRSSTKENLAIFTLANDLLKRGNRDDAKVLLTEALDQAQFYGNKLHSSEIIATLTTLRGQMLIAAENSKNKILTFQIVTVLIGLFILLVLTILVYKKLRTIRARERIVKEKNKLLDRLNKKLLEDTHIKEEYIGYFFDIISNHIIKLEKLKRNLEHKLKIKSYDDLTVIANEIDIRQERHKLYHTFDTTFLKMFPNFVSSFNSLFDVQNQIWPRENEALNTNLRIFALQRLGIKDNQKIADILQSSVNTIYTYKKRLRVKALVPPDEFESRIMDIQFDPDTIN